MFSFFHTADIHLGAFNQPPEYQDSIRRLIDAACKEKINTIVIAGDIFDRHNPDQRVKDKFIDDLINSNITWIIFPGNHDYINKAKDYHPLKTFNMLKKLVANVHICEENTYVEFNDVVFYGLSEWGQVPDIKTKKKLVGIWHGIAKSFNTESNTVHAESSKATKKWIEEGQFDYIAIGDIHKRIELHNRCRYPGALTPKKYSCEHGYLRVTLEEDKTIVNKRKLQIPERVTLSVSYDSNEDTEDTLADQIIDSVEHKSLVRLKFKLPVAEWAVLDTKKLEKLLKEYFIDIKLVNEPIQETRSRKNIDKISKAKSVGEKISIILDDNEFGVESNILKDFCIKKYNKS